MPTRVNTKKESTAQFKREFSYQRPNSSVHINSLSLSCDGDTFISADELTVNLWNIDHPLQIFNVVDKTPLNMESLDEVITSAVYHPKRAHLFMYTTSKGIIGICDFREQSHFSRPSLQLSSVNPKHKTNFFTEIINVISSGKFSQDGNYLVIRDYLSVKFWDLRYSDQPLQKMKLGDFIETNLCDLFESKGIYDKFEVAVSPRSNYIMTGSYGDKFHIIDKDMTSNLTLTANFEQRVPHGGPIDFTKKIRHLACHPTENIVALANHNCLFTFRGS